jgi:hypothetical protein
MSSVAQEQTTIPSAGDQAAPSAPAAAPSAPPAAKTQTSSRSYTLFEEARSDTWTKLGEAEADSPDAALETLGEQKLKSGQRFMAIPSRFVRPVKPNITTVTTISFD